jgi:hypothetical protein
VGVSAMKRPSLIRAGHDVRAVLFRTSSRAAACQWTFVERGAADTVNRSNPRAACRAAGSTGATRGNAPEFAAGAEGVARWGVRGSRRRGSWFPLG